MSLILKLVQKRQGIFAFVYLNHKHGIKQSLCKADEFDCQPPLIDELFRNACFIGGGESNPSIVSLIPPHVMMMYNSPCAYRRRAIQIIDVPLIQTINPHNTHSIHQFSNSLSLMRTQHGNQHYFDICMSMDFGATRAWSFGIQV